MIVPTRTLVICALMLSAGAALAQPVELANDRMTLRFDPEDGYAVSGIVNAQGVNFIAPRPEGVEQDRSPWVLHLRGPALSVEVTAGNAREAAHVLDGDTLTITWSGITAEGLDADLTVTATVRLPAGSAKAHWRAEVSGTSRGYLWQVDFPRVVGIRDFADAQMSLPYYWGRLVRKPMQLGRAASLVYPEPASMQWFAFWGVDEDRDPPLAEEEGRNSESGWSPDYSDAAGLYWAAEDGEVYFKRFAWDPTLPGEQLSWHIENIPGLPTWPMPDAEQPGEVAYEMPYEATVATFTGDWHEGAQLYLDWAQGQSWAQRGPVDQWPDTMPEPGSDELARWTPPWFREIGFWAKFYHEPAKILPEWAAYRKWTRVPMASHWYRYNIATFNDNDPEHLPPDPYVLDGVRAARELGVEPMPYVLATIWDTDTQSWIREDGLRSAVKTEGGEIVPWEIGNNVFAWMCPSTEQWRAKMREICGQLIWEHGMSGVYLDVLAAGAARPCFDPSHGHPISGGNYWGQGNRKLMLDLRAEIRRLDPDACFFTEEIGEHLIDVMDGYLTLDLTRNYTPGGEQVWPVLEAVYHPYTIAFGSDANLTMAPEQFAVIYGRQLVWGSQPLHSVINAPMPQEGDPTAEMFRDYTQAYYVAGQPFLMGGRMLRMAVRPLDAPAGQCGLELASAAHTVPYDPQPGRLKLWTGPAVLGSAWERFGDIGIVLANLTGEEQAVELTVRAEALGLAGGEQIVRLWPGDPEATGAAAGAHELTLPAWRSAFYCITTDPQRATARRRPLDDTPWELAITTGGPLPSAQGPAQSLFACSDGPVLNAPGEGGNSTVATAYRWDDAGDLVPREGIQADRRGAAAEAHGLPRDLDLQPFALLRRLPHTASVFAPGVMVLSGDDQHLLAVMPGGGQVNLSAPGLLVITNARTGEVVRDITAPPTDEEVLPEGEAFMVGWARFDEAEMGGLLQFGDAGVAARVRPFADSLRALADSAGDARLDRLADASRSFLAVAQSLDDLPGMLSPVGPLEALRERLNALLIARLGVNVRLRAQHPWLAAGLDKQVAALVMGGEAESVELHPVGDPAAGTMTVERAGESAVVGDTAVYPWRLRLDDGDYVRRVLPVVAAASVPREGRQFVVTDILRLEVNWPYQLIYTKTPVTTVAGAERTATITARNWSPIDLELRLDGAGPEGWAVAPMADSLDVPALSDVQFEVAVTPAADARQGSYDVRATANHATGPSTEFVAVLPVTVLDALVPLTPGEVAWEPPPIENRARIRNASKFAIYAEAGETIAVTIANIRVTRYVDTLSWRLLGPSMEVLEEGSVRVDEQAEIAHVAEVAGTCYLEVIPKQGSADVQIANRGAAEVATAQDPLQLFGSPITRTFFVPAGSTGFRLGARDGGPTEGARFVITSPTGRVALEADGNFNGVEIPVEVEADEDGKLWTLRVEPRQDLALWLAGDVLPYLSTSPERILVRATDR